MKTDSVRYRLLDFSYLWRARNLATSAVFACIRFFLRFDYSEIDEILRLQYKSQVVIVSYPEDFIQGVNCGVVKSATLGNGGPHTVVGPRSAKL
jgi:hypothetical protein